LARDDVEVAKALSASAGPSQPSSSRGNWAKNTQATLRAEAPVFIPQVELVLAELLETSGTVADGTVQVERKMNETEARIHEWIQFAGDLTCAYFELIASIPQHVDGQNTLAAKRQKYAQAQYGTLPEDDGIPFCAASFWHEMEICSSESLLRVWCPFELDDTINWSVHLTRSLWTSLHCIKCETSSEACFCSELFCRRCLNCASDCVCETPWVKRRYCSECLNLEMSINLYTTTFYDAPLEPRSDELCVECGSARFVSDTGPEGVIEEYYCMNSASSCAVCFRVDAQELIDPCDGRGCHAMIHLPCGKSVLGDVFCNDCVSSGNRPWDDEEEEEEEENESTDSA
jgi:hypothetical protein